MIRISRPWDDRERTKTLAQQGFPPERVTGIEPAWPTWKASGTRSCLSVKWPLTCAYLFLILTAVVRIGPHFTGRTAPLRPGVLVYGAASLGSAQVIAMASRTGRALRRVVSQTEGSVTVSLCRRGGGE